jgi:hypothetical protein
MDREGLEAEKINKFHQATFGCPKKKLFIE